jgi:hypothetical protein
MTLGFRTFAAALLAVVSTQAFAAIFTVGSDGSCTNGTIQSAIDDADASPGPDTIRLTRSLTYEPEANTVETDQDLSIVGGFETCTSSASDGTKTVVSGGNATGQSVFRITANGAAMIKLRLLTITQGNTADVGGGINFRGTGLLQILESDITQNTAAYGGGIFAEATGSNAELIISGGTTISGNTALYSGGGLYVGGPIEMTMSDPATIIAFNEAIGQDGIGGYGGGLGVVGPGIAYIGSPGAFGLGAIYGNSARHGGGVSVIAGTGDTDPGVVRMFATDPFNPPSIQSNSASESGGGVYLKPYYSLPAAHATFCASDFRIIDNIAPDGSAIHSDHDDDGLGDWTGATVYLNATCPSPAPCAAGVLCNAISGNGTYTSGGDLTDGATIRVDDGSLVGARVAMQGNRGGYLTRSIDGDNAIFTSFLLTDNDVSQRLISTEGTGVMQLTNCTIANNAIGSTDVLYDNGVLAILATIIDQPGNLALAYSGDRSNIFVQDILSTDLISLPADPSVVFGEPLFVDAANGNYRQRLASPGVDFAPPYSGSEDIDLDGMPRDVDMTGVPDFLGPRDLGAYERQAQPFDCGAADTILCDGFELL